MHNLLSVFSTTRLWMFGYFLVIAFSIYAQSQENIPFSSYKYFIILPLEESNNMDCKWADYLYNQASARNLEKGIVIKNSNNSPKAFSIVVHIASEPSFDYTVKTGNNTVTLTASSEDNMLWLIYQWLSKMAETDSRWQTNDLDPSILETEYTDNTFDFKYRSIYSPSLSEPEKIKLTGNWHVDYHWGLWGHNLNKLFPKGIPEEAQALVNGKKNNTQFCFTSTTLYNTIANYIIDAYGEGEQGNASWFAIMPNDNHNVCTCQNCIKAGNTSASATPAVTRMLQKLASRFPNHQFYTSAYATTIIPPAQKLPENAGVIISTINVPLNTTCHTGKKYTDFQEQLEKWQKATSHIIIWDYMRNFDDYLTPFPCLESIQHRLKWFKKLGVWGVFYNGSGDDYSIFDDLQTYIISALLKNTNIDLKNYINAYLKHFYPTCWKLLADYYWELENIVKERNISLEWYEGINFALGTYLDPNTLNRFYIELDRISKYTSGEERKRLNYILTALNFTQLEIIRSGKSSREAAQNYIELLKGSKELKHFTKYKEANGLLSDYIESWSKYMENSANGHTDISVTELESGKKLSMLSDGYHGFPYDYHMHWYVSANNKNLFQIHSTSKKQGEIVLTFLQAPAWKISMPQAVEIRSKNGTTLAQWENAKQQIKDFTINKVVLHVDMQQDDTLEIVITKGKLTKKIALDEIEWYEKNN